METLSNITQAFTEDAAAESAFSPAVVVSHLILSGILLQPLLTPLVMSQMCCDSY